MLFFLLCAIGFSATAQQEEQFKTFIRDFNRTYLTDEVEYKARLQIFVENLGRIAELNKVEGATFGVTQFADLTPLEFKSQYLTARPYMNPEDDAPVLQIPLNVTAASSIDWRQNGAVTPTYDQGQCGSCWAFAATEALESQMALHRYGLQQLSMQQVVSCDNYDYGCNGGNTYTAYTWMKNNGGITTGSAYPYTSGSTRSTGYCQTKSHSSAAVKGYSWATSPCQSGSCDYQDENKVLSAVSSYGPPSVCVNADAWQHYTGGVMTDYQCGSHAIRAQDHCVQMTGYNSNYFIVRNSWGTRWGYAGYIYLQRHANTCGVLNTVSFPVI